MSGTLYGLGVGPGDPELLTLKAHRLIRSAGVIAYPAPDTGESFARAIVAEYMPDGATEIAIVIPMRSERFPAQEVYDSAATEIAQALEAGQDVVVLCEGDPFFYGSFMYLFSRLSDRFPTEIVPGVSSLGAVTAAASQPLIAREEVLTVLPATLEESELERHLADANAAAIMKLGRHFGKTRAVLDRLGMTERARFVSHASLPNQNVCPLSEAPETAPYFSMIIVPGKDAHV
ncbi:precorrin-2/cobalt-factor-2 C20-methyltransferase [Aliiruegeria haliotis]|uniref:Precorrin-2/cobalt-factor-2 C20-methyltransferase n=1 Tax=Aliiruegeria haliotis TaxID=1280846 RepID=A0A2T0RYD0_9RHOB|nr:precorrin-2 C(20)-methyltransferase [Aliiruegeria haliotis]PRY26184.1 precorrin-2/cobalt-factor-2 C20-methyltransferase [Aliiruegeria haliotis]